MSSAELLIIAIVALLVFGPNKLPMLARHLGLMTKQLAHWQGIIRQHWQQIQLHQQLADNTDKAAKADKLYIKRLETPDLKGAENEEG